MHVVESAIAMARKPRSTERQVHPTGERWTVDDRFKTRVRSKLEEEGISQADLADKISVGAPSITNLLKPGRSQSRLVPRILKAFKWQYVIDESGVVVVVDNVDALRRIQRNLPQLSESDAELVAKFVESLAEKR